jgi:lipoprotein-anchoring transpeptidase ErfK/SrfK
MKIKIFLLLTFLIFSSLSFSACGDKKEDTVASEDTSNSSDDTIIDSENIMTDEEEEELEEPEESETPTDTPTESVETTKANDTTVEPAYTEKSKVESTPTITVKNETTTNSKTETPTETPKTTTTATTEKSGGSTTEYLIIINKSTNKLHLYKNKSQIATYPVATGREASLTPEGKFTIVTKAKDPSWKNSDGEIIPGGTPENPLGDYWLGLSIGGGYNYGIHGTNNESSIGSYASGGCIRMYNSDVAKVYSSVPKGSEVWIGQYSTLPNP